MQEHTGVRGQRDSGRGSRPTPSTCRGRVDERTFKDERAGHLTQLRQWFPVKTEFALQDKLTNHADYETSTRSSITATSGAPDPGGGCVSTPVKQISVQRLRQSGTQGAGKPIWGPPRFLRRDGVSTWCPTAIPRANTLAVLNNKGCNRGGGGLQHQNSYLGPSGRTQGHPAQGYVTGIESPVPAMPTAPKYQRPLGLVPKIQPGRPRPST